MYCIVIISIWTGNKHIYPVLYATFEEANKLNIPYSSRNNKFEIKQLN